MISVVLHEGPTAADNSHVCAAGVYVVLPSSVYDETIKYQISQFYLHLRISTPLQNTNLYSLF